MEIILELVCEIYLELATILVPEHKFKKWQEILLKILSVTVTLGILICLGVGISFLIDKNSSFTTGIILTVVGGTFALIQIVLFVIVIKKQIKIEKAKKENEE